MADNRSCRFSFGSELWSSVKNRTSKEITLNDAVDYLLLKFVCDDRIANPTTSTTITKEMVVTERKRFEDLLNEVKVNKK